MYDGSLTNIFAGDIRHGSFPTKMLAKVSGKKRVADGILIPSGRAGPPETWAISRAPMV